jgi:hypothetical protein
LSDKKGGNMDYIDIEDEALVNIINASAEVPPLPHDVEIEVKTDTDGTCFLGIEADTFFYSIYSPNEAIFSSVDIPKIVTLKVVLEIEDYMYPKDNVTGFRIIGNQKQVKQAINALTGYQVYEQKYILT